ncbi:MAG: universal stress protein [Phototrophicales bacterium]
MLKNILVPLDGSQVAERALDYAEQIIDPEGKLTLLTVIDVPDYPAAMFYPAGIATYELSKETAQNELIPQAQEYLKKIASNLMQKGLQNVRTEAVIGEPASSIVEKADQLAVDAIVMSTHGRTGVSRWLFGSVANKVLNSTERPIFIIPVKR